MEQRHFRVDADIRHGDWLEPDFYDRFVLPGEAVLSNCLADLRVNHPDAKPLQLGIPPGVLWGENLKSLTEARALVAYDPRYDKIMLAVDLVVEY